MATTETSGTIRRIAALLFSALLIVSIAFGSATVFTGNVAAQPAANTTYFDGYTYDESGEPIQGTNVSVLWISGGKNVKYTSTNESGYFNVSGIETGAVLYLIKMEKWDGNTIKYSSESQFTPLPWQYFENLGTNGYYLTKAANVNVTILPYDVQTGNHDVQYEENHSATGYGDSLEWMNDSDQWAYLDTQNNTLRTLYTNFTDTGTNVSIPVQDATGLYYNGSNEFYTLNSSKDSKETAVWVFNISTGTLVRNYSITNTETNRYDKVGDLDKYNNSFYISGHTGSETVIDKYNKSFYRVETKVAEDTRVGNFVRHDGYWYWGKLAEIQQRDDDWNSVERLSGESKVNMMWRSSLNISGLAHNGTGWYLGINETGSISEVRFPDLLRDGYAQGYEPEDVATGVGLGGGHDDSVTYQNFSFSGPINREYNIVIDKELSSVGLNYHISNITSEEGWNSTANRLNLEINLSSDRRRVTGYVDNNGSHDFDNLSVVYWKTRGDRLDWKANANRTGKDQFSPGDGYFNISIDTPTQYDERYVLFATAYRNATDQHYGAFQTITLQKNGGDISDFNMSLEPLAGEEDYLRPKPFGPPPEYVDKMDDASLNDDNEVVMNVTTAVKTFELMNGSSSTQASLSNLIGFLGQVTMDYTEYWDDSATVKHTPMGGTKSFQWSGSNFTIPAFGKEGIDAWIMTPEFAPRKKALTRDEIESNDPIKINLTQFDPGTIGDSTTSLNISLYRGEESGQPHPSGLIESSNESTFNPLKVPLLGGHLGLRVTDEERNITVHYDNVDPTKSGPPDALFDSTPEQTETEDALKELWRFGSTGPEAYDKVLLSMPYNESLDDSTITVEITQLYDEDFNEVWNASTDNISDIETDSDLKPYRDYLDNEYEAYLNGSGVVADENDPTLSDGIAYKDVDTHQVWMEIPHFTGVGMEVEGTVQSGGGGSGGGSSDSTDDGGDEDEETTDDGADQHIGPHTAETHDAVQELVPDSVTLPTDANATRGELTNITVDPKTNKSRVSFTNKSVIEGVDFGNTVLGQCCVVELDRAPGSAGTPPGKSVSVVQIDVPEHARNESATVRSRVPRERVSAVDAEPEDLIVTRFDDRNREWVLLETNLTEITNTSVHLNAETPGFSHFAVTGISEPVASLETAEEVNVGQKTILDASGSTSENTSIINYNWTIDGESVPGNETLTYAFWSPGLITVNVSVENEAGRTNTTSTDIIVVEPQETTTTTTVTTSMTTTVTGTSKGTTETSSLTTSETPPETSRITTASETETPGFTVVWSLVALLGASLLVLYRREE